MARKIYYPRCFDDHDTSVEVQLDVMKMRFDFDFENSVRMAEKLVMEKEKIEKAWPDLFQKGACAQEVFNRHINSPDYEENVIRYCNSASLTKRLNATLSDLFLLVSNDEKIRKHAEEKYLMEHGLVSLIDAMVVEGYLPTEEIERKETKKLMAIRLLDEVLCPDEKLKERVKVGTQKIGNIHFKNLPGFRILMNIKSREH